MASTPPGYYWEGAGGAGGGGDSSASEAYDLADFSSPVSTTLPPL